MTSDATYGIYVGHGGTSLSDMYSTFRRLLAVVVHNVVRLGADSTHTFPFYLTPSLSLRLLSAYNVLWRLCAPVSPDICTNEALAHEAHHTSYTPHIEHSTTGWAIKRVYGNAARIDADSVLCG